MIIFLLTLRATRLHMFEFEVSIDRYFIDTLKATIRVA